MSTPRTEDRPRVFALEALVPTPHFRLAMGNEMTALLASLGYEVGA